MHLAILMANTDESEFAARHPKDGEKFTQLFRQACGRIGSFRCFR